MCAHKRCVQDEGDRGSAPAIPNGQAAHIFEYVSMCLDKGVSTDLVHLHLIIFAIQIMRDLIDVNVLPLNSAPCNSNIS
jgi:hypothetical protein